METSPFLPFIFTALLAICSTLAFLLIYLRSSFGSGSGRNNGSSSGNNSGTGSNSFAGQVLNLHHSPTSGNGGGANHYHHRPQLSIKAYNNNNLNHNYTSLSPLSHSPVSPSTDDDDSPPILCTFPIRSSAKSKHKKRLMAWLVPHSLPHHVSSTSISFASISPAVYICMTTLPSRIHHIDKCLASLKAQSYPIKRILLSLPEHSRREQTSYSIPERLTRDSLVTIIRTNVDCGPSTRLIAALHYLDPSILIPASKQSTFTTTNSNPNHSSPSPSNHHHTINVNQQNAQHSTSHSQSTNASSSPRANGISPSSQSYQSESVNILPTVSPIQTTAYGPSSAAPLMAGKDAILILADDDCIYHPDAVAILIRHALAFPHSALGFAGYRLLGSPYVLNNVLWCRRAEERGQRRDEDEHNEGRFRKDSFNHIHSSSQQGNGHSMNGKTSTPTSTLTTSSQSTSITNHLLPAGTPPAIFFDPSPPFDTFSPIHVRDLHSVRSVDVLASYRLSLYRLRFFDSTIYDEYAQFPSSAFWCDDEWISAHVSKHGISRRVILVPLEVEIGRLKLKNGRKESITSAAIFMARHATTLEQLVTRGLFPPHCFEMQ